MRVSKTLLTAALALFLSYPACVTDTDFPEESREENFRLLATLPPRDTPGVEISSKIIFHFNRDLDATALDASYAEIARVESDGGRRSVPLSLAVSGANLILKPAVPLRPNSVYEAKVRNDIPDIHGDHPQWKTNSNRIFFSTGALRPRSDSPPAITTLRPFPTEAVYDWTTFRLEFSEPIDYHSTIYGVTISLRKKGGQSPVPAQMLISGAKVVIDPDSDLVPGEVYELFISKNLLDSRGESAESERIYTYTILDSNPRSSLFLEMCPTMGDRSGCEPVANESAMKISSYTGELLNSIVMESVMLGRTHISLSGRLRVEMGDMAKDPAKVPIAIRKGQKLFGRSITANFGGVIPSGLETGEVVLTVLTDAHGFMMSSREAHGVKNGEVWLSLPLDVAMSTAGEEANALMGQSILDIKLYGRATVEGGGLLTMELAGFASVEILGERIPITMSLSMIPQRGTPSVSADAEGPKLLSSYPKAYEDRMSLGDRIVLYFSEAVDPAGIEEFITLRDAEGEEVGRRLRVDGPRVILTPTSPMVPDAEFSILIGPGLGDILGNPMEEGRRIRFWTGPPETADFPPMVGTTDPALDSPERLPAHMPIRVFFTQLMDPGSMVLGMSFRVTDMDNGEEVPGVLETGWYGAIFTPNDPFVPDRRYRFTLTDDIASFIGVALDVDGDGVPGGSDETPFVAGTFIAGYPDESFPLIFKLWPAVDVNGNGLVDEKEKIDDANSFAMNIFDLFPTPTYASGYLIAHVHALVYDNEEPTLPIVLRDGIRLYGTSITAPSLPLIGEVDTGMVSIQSTALGSADLVEGWDGDPKMLMSMETYFTVADESFNDMLDHSLSFSSRGDMIFSDEGRAIALISGKASVGFTFPIIDLTLPVPVSIKMRAISLVR